MKERSIMAKLSQKRKATYYIGMGIMILGLVLFFSVFISVFMMMSNPSSFHIPPIGNGFIGFILGAIGNIVMRIGAKGAAGSGLLLDPEQAREDLKPFNEAKGGMINDMINQIDVVDDIIKTSHDKEIIKIKCRSCGALNDEDAKFCKGCGASL
jgi:hypothetical protein